MQEDLVAHGGVPTGRAKLAGFVLGANRTGKATLLVMVRAINSPP